MTLDYEYKNSQLHLACLDVLCPYDHDAYSAVLDFAWTSSCVEAVGQMFDMNSAATFDGRDPETDEERYARWALEYPAPAEAA